MEIYTHADIFLKYFYNYNLLIIPGILFFFTIVPFPFPEELILLILGYISYKTETSLINIIIITYITVQTSDILLYYFGHLLKKISDKKFYKYKFIKNKISKGEFYFNKYGTKALFFARFIFGLRSSIFITSGFLKFGLKKFIIIDAAAGLINVPVVVCLGYFFPKKLEYIWNLINQTKIYILIFLILFFIVRIVAIKKIKKITLSSKI